MSIFELTHAAAQRCDAVFKATAGISPRQYAILRQIEKSPGLLQADIVERTGIDRSTTSEILGRMVAAGLVDRRQAEDARGKSLRLTEKGRKVLDAAKGPARRAERMIARQLGDHAEVAILALQKIGSKQEGATA